jgi:hypothetical protein
VSSARRRQRGKEEASVAGHVLSESPVELEAARSVLSAGICLLGLLHRRGPMQLFVRALINLMVLSLSGP